MFLNLTRLSFVGIVELLGAAHDFASGHVHLVSVFVEEGIPVVFPDIEKERVVAHAALRQPNVPQAIDIASMQVKHRILRRCQRRTHPPADVYMDIVVGVLLYHLAGRKKSAAFKPRTADGHSRRRIHV